MAALLQTVDEAYQALTTVNQNSNELNKQREILFAPIYKFNDTNKDYVQGVLGVSSPEVKMEGKMKFTRKKK